MKNLSQKPVVKLVTSAVLISLGTVLSLFSIIKMPLGGSVTPLSMLPIVMVGIMYGAKWGMSASFVYALGQLALGLASVLSWGLTPGTLIGTLMLDYVIAFSLLGVVSFFRGRGDAMLYVGITVALLLRFVSHFISGVVIFANYEQFEIFGNAFLNKPYLYSFSYNMFYMLPEILFTLVGTIILFNIPAIRKLVGLPARKGK